MPWTILEELWKRTQEPHLNADDRDSASFNKEVETLYKLGISLETTLRYLYFEKPALNEFKAWITNKTKVEAQTEESIAIHNVLSEDDLAFWDENGYVVVKGAIDREDCLATQQAIWDYLRRDPNDQQAWYQPHEELRGLMLNFADHETLNKNRNAIKIKKAYEQLYQTKAIYKTIDKVSFNPPETNSFRFLGSSLHWDISLKTPIPFSLQGLLYLTDCAPNGGAFHCVPGFHHEIESWLKALDAHEKPREKALETLISVPVAGEAGDFVIWNSALPHCASPNRGTVPRMVQYLTYLPIDHQPATEWI